MTADRRPPSPSPPSRVDDTLPDHQVPQDLLRGDEAVRIALPGGGALSLDRRLPFLLVHRDARERADKGTAMLLTGEAAYLLSRAGDEKVTTSLVRSLATAGSAEFGAFLIIEIWSAEQPESQRFVVHAPDRAAPETIGRLVGALRELAEVAPETRVEVEYGDRRHPAGLSPLLTVEESWKTEVLVVGLEVPPIYRDPRTGELYPLFFRTVRRELSRALRQAVHEFVRVQTTVTVEHHLGLGTRRLPDRVWEVDRALCSLEAAFDPLLLVTPVNGDEAWAEFRRSRFERNPKLFNRLLPFDPDLFKRRLFSIQMETIEDPAIAELYQEKRTELDLLLSMLGERGTGRFRFGSQRLYGTVDGTLQRTAETLLREVPPARAYTGPRVGAIEFRNRAEAELKRFSSIHPPIDRKVEIRRDITGLLVSEGNLLIGERLSLRPERLEPLLQHEVGTHVLTYVNGAAQPMEQLARGLAHYDELQEGLAVLAEYLAGGLDRLRMRLLAARVLAARSVELGADFVETFRLLTDDLGYTPAGAWQISLRVHASGGFTRDLIYLRGLVQLLEYVRRGGDLRPLFIGKIALKHLPIIEELRYRGILREPPLTPPLLEDPEALDRLAALHRGITLPEMICSPGQ